MSVRSSLSHFALPLLLAVFAVGCGGKDSGEADSGSDGAAPTASMTAEAGSQGGSSPSSANAPEAHNFGGVSYPLVQPTVEKRPVADPHPQLLVRTSEGEFTIELDREKAPQTVDNFLVNYVNRGFYDDTCFHYVEKDFMAAAGGFTPDLKAKEPRASIRNESRNGLKNLRGTIAMARHPEYPHSATSQFFINLVDNPSLDHQELTPVSTTDVDVAEEKSREELEEEDDSYQPNGYCVFGKVIRGMDVVDRIGSTNVSDRPDFPQVPVKPIVIQSIERIN